MLRLDPNEKLKLDEQDSKIFNDTLTSPETIIEIPNKSNVDSIHEHSRSARELLSVSDDQDNEFDKIKLTNLHSFTVNGDPNSENELTLEKCLKVYVGHNVNHLSKYDKIQITDITNLKTRNIGQDIICRWYIRCNDKLNNGKIPNFIKSKKTSSPTSHSGATSLTLLGDSFIYVETSSGKNGTGVFVSFEQTDFIQISNISFYYKR